MSHQKLMERWFEEVWNQGNANTIDELLENECQVYGLEEDMISCPDEFKHFHKKLNQAFTNIHIQMDHFVENGEHFSGVGVFRGKHQAKGSDITFEFGCFGTIRSGKIVEARNVVDFLSMLVQTEALPKNAVELGLEGKSLVG